MEQRGGGGGGAFKSYTITHYLLDDCFTSGCYYRFCLIPLIYFSKFLLIFVWFFLGVGTVVHLFLHNRLMKPKLVLNLLCTQ